MSDPKHTIRLMALAAALRDVVMPYPGQHDTSHYERQVDRAPVYEHKATGCTYWVRTAQERDDAWTSVLEQEWETLKDHITSQLSGQDATLAATYLNGEQWVNDQKLNHTAGQYLSSDGTEREVLIGDEWYYIHARD